MAAVTPNNSKWTRCYHAKSDGFTAHGFHSRCDNKGPTVTLVQVREFVFGGFLDQNWGGKLNISIIIFFYSHVPHKVENYLQSGRRHDSAGVKEGGCGLSLGRPMHSDSSN